MSVTVVVAVTCDDEAHAKHVASELEDRAQQLNAELDYTTIDGDLTEDEPVLVDTIYPDCVICGERTKEDDCAEMYDPTADEHAGSGWVHPECGLQKGWEIA